MKTQYWVLVCMVLIMSSLLISASCGDDDDDDDDDSTTVDDDDSADDDDSTDDDTTDDDTTDDDDDSTDPFDVAEANPGTWVWVPVEGATCRDGSATGFGLRLQDGADKLAIFFQGGGACYDASSCADNPSSFGEANLMSMTGNTLTSGIFNDGAKGTNPVADYNFVYIPYCTGDLHAANTPEGFAPGAGSQIFVGYNNFTLDLAVFGPYFQDASKVLVAGESAGGWGATFNFPQVGDSEYFDGTPLVLFDDSGPLVELDDALAPCYQLLLQFLWNPIIPAGCTDCIQANGDGLSNLYPYYSDTYANATFGLFSTYADETIRDFWGLGQDNCSGDSPIPAETYEQGLVEMRDDVLIATGKWATYFVDDDYHTLSISETRFTTTTVDSTEFTDWLSDLLDGTVSQVSP